MPSVKARLARLAVETDEADREAEEETREPARFRGAEHRRHGGERQHHHAKYSAGPNLSAKSTTHRRHHRQQDGRDGAGDERTDGEVASAGPARPRLAIRLPSIAVTMVADSPGVLSRMDVVEPPNIAP